MILALAIVALWTSTCLCGIAALVWRLESKRLRHELRKLLVGLQREQNRQLAQRGIIATLLDVENRRN